MNFANFTGKYLCWSEIVKFAKFCEVPVKSVKFLGPPFFTEHFRWLLLSHLLLEVSPLAPVSRVGHDAFRCNLYVYIYIMRVYYHLFFFKSLRVTDASHMIS